MRGTALCLKRAQRCDFMPTFTTIGSCWERLRQLRSGSDLVWSVWSSRHCGSTTPASIPQAGCTRLRPLKVIRVLAAELGKWM